MPHSTFRSGGRARRGFTLAEMLIAITMLGLFGASAITFYLRSLRSVTNTAGRNDAQQNAAFGLDFVDHDLRIAGTNLATGQPLMVEAASNAIVFNADLITHDTSASAGGTYYDPNVPDSVALAWRASSAQSLPFSAIPYPDQSYFQDSAGTVLSEAETVAFWVAKDTTNPLPNRFNLWRRVNNNSAAIVARGIYSLAAAPTVFTYYYENASNALVQFPSTSIPVYHQAAIPAMQARLDSIREVRVQFTGAFTDPHTGQTIQRSVNEVVRIPNSYMSRISQCPGPPQPTSALSAFPSTGGVDTVGLQWTASPDDGSGRQTARMYLIYRKKHTDTTYVQINALTATDSASYHFQDAGLTGATAYDYGVSVRDCTPSMSTMTRTLNVTPN